MKIAIIGAHSTGKTTLIKKLEDKIIDLGHEVITLPEFSRLCPFPVNEKTNFDAQKWIQDQQIQNEINVDHKGKLLITDRATLDNFAYMARAIKDRDISEVEENAASHMSTYDYIFKTTKLAIKGIEDGFRSIDDVFRDEIDKLIFHFLHKHEVGYTPLPETLDYDTHINFILNKIGLQPALAYNLI